MERRQFLFGAAAASAVSAVSAASAPLAAAQATASKLRPGQRKTMLAGYSLAQLRDLYRRDLFADWLPFMQRYVIDSDHGGFLCNTNFDGTQVDTEKNALFEGRGIWVYSSLYTHFGKDKRYLEVATRSVELLRKSQPADEALWCTTLHRDGSPASPASSVIATDLAIAEGFAAYAQASGKQEFVDRARKLLQKCVQAYDRPDYNPAVGRAYFGASAPAFPGARSVGSWMVLLRTAAQILEVDHDAQTDRVARLCAENVLRHHFAPEFGLNAELLNHDLTRPANEYAEVCNLGNTFEITWMLLDEAMRQRDDSMFHLCAERFQRHAEVAWDGVYGGAFHSLLSVDENRYQMNKILWVQEEWLVDALYVYAHMSASWAADAFGRMYRYVRDKFPLDSHGSPLWMYASGRKATFEEFTALPKRVENYHHPRHLMRNLRRLESMIPVAKRS
jgi:N-acylglucosamine 2-epimerase